MESISKSSSSYNTCSAPKYFVPHSICSARVELKGGLPSFLNIEMFKTYSDIERLNRILFDGQKTYPLSFFCKNESNKVSILKPLDASIIKSKITDILYPETFTEKEKTNLKDKFVKAIQKSMQRSEFHYRYMNLSLKNAKYILWSTEYLVANGLSLDQINEANYNCEEDAILLTDFEKDSGDEAISNKLLHENVHRLDSISNSIDGNPAKACKNKSTAFFIQQGSPYKSINKKNDFQSSLFKGDVFILGRFKELFQKSKHTTLTKDEKAEIGPFLKAAEYYQPLRWPYHVSDNLPKDKHKREKAIEDFKNGESGVKPISREKWTLYSGTMYEAPNNKINIKGFLVPRPYQNKIDALIADTEYRTTTNRFEYQKLARSIGISSEASTDPEDHANIILQDPKFSSKFYPEVLKQTENLISTLEKQPVQMNFAL